jgi:SAM-dependent methyltransferase
MLSNDPVIRDLEIMSGAPHYNDWLYAQFGGHIGKRIIEVGAGTGNFTSRFLDRELVVTVDFYAPCVEYLKNNFAQTLQVVPLRMDIASPEARDLKQYRPDTVICVNVLEHVKDDDAALANMFYILGKGGLLAIVVPAFQQVYGTVDRLVGHYRRYTKTDIHKKVAAAGFTVRDAYYLNSLGLFGWFLNNRIMEISEESPSQVKLYDRAVVPWLRILENIFRPPFGLSVVVLAVKEKA